MNAVVEGHFPGYCVLPLPRFKFFLLSGDPGVRVEMLCHVGCDRRHLLHRLRFARNETWDNAHFGFAHGRGNRLAVRGRGRVGSSQLIPLLRIVM